MLKDNLGWIYIPFYESYVFPNKCVYCLSPVDIKIDHSIFRKITEWKIDKQIEYDLGIDVRGIPYCMKHAKRSEHLKRVSKVIGNISVIFGLLVVAAGLYYLIKTKENGETLTFDVVGGLIFVSFIFGGIFFLIVKTLCLFKYPDIWKIGETSMLGFKAIIKAHVSTGVAKIDGISFKFDNKEYEKLFLEVKEKKLI